MHDVYYVQYGYIDIFIYKQSIIIVDKLFDMTQNIIVVFLVDFIIIIDFVNSLDCVCAVRAVLPLKHSPNHN